MNRLPMRKIAAIAFDSMPNFDAMLDRCNVFPCFAARPYREADKLTFLTLIDILIKTDDTHPTELTDAFSMSRSRKSS